MSTFPIPGLEAVTPRPTPSTESLLEGLNEPQRAAVVHAGPPLLVVAGAGSGKTRVLTRRIAWLIPQRKAHPGSILAITFTNKAAAEMKERVEDLVGKRARIMWVSTFHSACVRILRKEIDKLGFKSSFSIYDAADSKRLMTLVCQDLDLDPKRYQPRAVLNWVSNAKNELKDPEDATKDTRNDFEEAYAAAYELYQRRLRDANALDFDDLIMTTVHLFQAFPEVREIYRRRFRHVLVDEYQDTNHAQYALIHQLCADPMEETGSGGERVAPAELMVVGDADQSIYAFRGANIRNILDFEQDFPNATTILLEQNYRSTQTILNAANAVIGHNKGRKAKRLWSQAGDGDKIVGYVADDEHDEARFVADEIDKLTDDGAARAGDVAVFYRTNAQSRVFEEVFIRIGHALQGRRRGALLRAPRGPRRPGLPPDAGQPGRRDLAAPGAQHPQARHRRPRRGLRRGARRARADRSSGRRCAGPTRRRASRPGRSTAIQGFVAMVEELQSMVDAGERADVVLESVLERSGYLAELEASDDPQDETRVENLAELVAVAREFSDDPVAGPSADPADVDAGTVAPGLSDFLERVALVADSDQIPDRARRGRRGGGHADDPAHRQGPGVPGGVPHRPRGRRLPPHAVARRPAGARGGAAAGVRRGDPGPRAALPLSRRHAFGVGCARPQPRLPVPRRDAGRPWSTGAAPRRSRPPGTARTSPAGPARSAAPPRRDAATSAPPRSGSTPRPRPSRPGRSRRSTRATGWCTTRSGWAPWSRWRVRATRRWRRSTSVPRASSACCCATRRWRSSRTASRAGVGYGLSPWATNASKGSTGSPAPGRYSRCRCGPVLLPVEPT